MVKQEFVCHNEPGMSASATPSASSIFDALSRHIEQRYIEQASMTL
jgi:hypothetical protein